MQAHTPVRTCIGCRGRDENTELVRLVLDATTDPGSVVPDRRRRMPGRGAWLHPRDACLQAALRKGAFHRAFRARVDTTLLAERLADDESGSEI